MDLRVRSEKIISEFQQEFQNEFPFLKIDFFSDQNQQKKSKVFVSKSFSAFKRNSQKIDFSIIPQMTVSQLYECFHERFYLDPQICRQSGKAWLETTLTENWTLQEQNEIGKALSSFGKTAPNSSSSKTIIL